MKKKLLKQALGGLSLGAVLIFIQGCDTSTLPGCFTSCFPWVDCGEGAEQKPMKTVQWWQKHDGCGNYCGYYNDGVPFHHYGPNRNMHQMFGECKIDCDDQEDVDTDIDPNTCPPQHVGFMHFGKNKGMIKPHCAPDCGDAIPYRERGSWFAKHSICPYDSNELSGFQHIKYRKVWRGEDNPEYADLRAGRQAEFEKGREHRVNLKESRMKASKRYEPKRSANKMRKQATSKKQPTPVSDDDEDDYSYSKQTRRK